VRYDSGDFVANMERALAGSGWDGFDARLTEAKARGRLRGIGLCSFVETSGGPAEEHAALRFTPDGLDLHCGTQSAGQGHETVFPRIVAGWLGLAEDRVRLVQGDHALGVGSGGAIASRSLVAAGGALKAGADAVIAKARTHAALALEAAESDIVFCAGELRVAGTDRSITLHALAERLQSGAQAHPLDCDASVRLGRSFPCGCHVAEVEIDPQTGVVTVVGYTAVDDVGAIQHEAIVEGQIHGGVAQGLGQALLEHCRYDAASGQLLSGSFLDYALPRADDLPPIAVLANTTPSPDHPFGAKGAGESGATGAPGAVMNAIAHALRPLGAGELDMPATPENVWRALSRRALR
jgi:carbon-monoxide dehydrogenase large subunit